MPTLPRILTLVFVLALTSAVGRTATPQPARVEGHTPVAMPAAIASTLAVAPVEVVGQPRVSKGHHCTIWDEEDLAHYKEMLKTSKELQAQFADVRAAAVVSGEMPPEVRKAMDQAMKRPIGTKYRYEALEAATQNWIKAAPAAAFEWAMKQSNVNGLRHDMVITAVNVWLKKDAPGAVTYITTRPSGDGWGWLSGCWGTVDPAAASDWAVKQPRDKWPAVFRGVSEGWARKDAPAAAAWVAQLPAEQGRYGYFFAASGLAWHDPPAAAAWVAKLPDCDARNDAAAVTAKVWSRKVPADKDKIIDWIKKLPIPAVKKAEILKPFEKN